MGFEQAADQRVLVFAPRGRDAQLIVRMLRESGIRGEAYTRIDSISPDLLTSSAAIILTEEALLGRINPLTDALSAQPAWSDLPIIILTTGGESSSEQTWLLLRRLDPIGNVTLLERPLRTITLISAVQVALRSRNRQYEVRSLYQDMEARVRERTMELKRLNDEAEGFSYTIAHDLRAPLRAIISTSRIVLEDCATSLPSDAVEQLQRQATAAAHLANLIDDLLRLSKLSREQMRPHAFDLTSMVAEVIEEIEKERECGTCAFEVQPQMTAFGDPLLIRLVLLNLMENACKFSPQGGTVRVGCKDGVYYVCDEGIGFAPEYATRIFKPFERLVNQEAFPGTGIGLANVKRIIERHGGSVWAESELGKGACFYFRLEEAPRSASVK